MKLGVVSDTHRNREYLNKAAKWLIHHQRIALLCHLGDDYDDVIELADEGIDILQVPGIYNPKYLDKTLPAKIQENIMGVRILLVHCMEKDVTKEDRAVADIILHGHTHRPELLLEDGLLKMNPGHLKGPKEKNIEPSFGLLDIGNKDVTASLFNLSFKPIQSIHMMRSETGLYKA